MCTSVEYCRRIVRQSYRWSHPRCFSAIFYQCRLVYIRDREFGEGAWKLWQIVHTALPFWTAPLPKLPKCKHSWLLLLTLCGATLRPDLETPAVDVDRISLAHSFSTQKLVLAAYTLLGQVKSSCIDYSVPLTTWIWDSSGTTWYLRSLLSHISDHCGLQGSHC